MFATNQTGHDTSMDQTTNVPHGHNSPSPYDVQTSFALDDLNQDSQLATDRGDHSSIKNRIGEAKHGSG